MSLGNIEMESAESFIKRHFNGIEKELWYPAIVAICEGYAKKVIENNNSSFKNQKPINMKLQVKLNVTSIEKFGNGGGAKINFSKSLDPSLVMQSEKSITDCALCIYVDNDAKDLFELGEYTLEISR